MIISHYIALQAIPIQYDLLFVVEYVIHYIVLRNISFYVTETYANAITVQSRRVKLWPLFDSWVMKGYKSNETSFEGTTDDSQGKEKGSQPYIDKYRNKN